MGMTQTMTISQNANYATISAEFETLELAQAAVAAFPKSYKLVARKVVGNGAVTGELAGSVVLKANAANGGVNESGLKRIETIAKKAAALGYTVNR